MALLLATSWLVSVISPVPGAGAQPSELVAAREEAAGAADAFVSAQFHLEQVEEDLARTGVDLAATRERRDGLAATMAEDLIERYVQGGGVGPPLLGEVDLVTQARADALSRAARGQVADQAELLRSADAQLRDQERTLRRQQADAEAAQAEAESTNEALRQRLAELEAIEAQRQEEERQAEVARRQAEAEAAALAQAKAYDEAAAARTSATPPATASADSRSGSGSGSASASVAVPERPVVRVDWLCPLTGTYSFSDTWGAARSNGRSHRGTDMFTAYGTPVVAVVGGTAVNYGWEGAGGNGVFLLGEDGNRYFYAHLDDFGTLGRVSQGDVVGYAGDTGNAVGSPHLHFEIHPGGSGWTNPYSTLANYC